MRRWIVMISSGVMTASDRHPASRVWSLSLCDWTGNMGPGPWAQAGYRCMTVDILPSTGEISQTSQRHPGGCASLPAAANQLMRARICLHAVHEILRLSGRRAGSKRRGCMV